MEEDLGKLADQIEFAHRASLVTAKTALKHAIDAGRLLIEAKKLVKHGDWLSWLERNTTVSLRQCQKYMRLYDKREELELDANTPSSSHLSISEAERLVAKPRISVTGKRTENLGRTIPYPFPPGTGAIPSLNKIFGSSSLPKKNSNIHSIHGNPSQDRSEPTGSLSEKLASSSPPLHSFGLRQLVGHWNALEEYERQAFLDVVNGKTDEAIELEDVMEARKKFWPFTSQRKAG